jgi:NADH-quinone oxidoreductase subunit J
VELPLTRDLILASIVVILGAFGTFLLLPHSHGALKPKNVHALGSVLAGLALLLFALFLKPLSPFFLTGIVFYVFAFAAIAGSMLTITSRDPVHSALWFASVILSTSGLFLVAGAQFLAVGTIIVYAGAIIVTFLFVIMLAQTAGSAPYDRSARMPLRASWTCFMLFFAVLWSLLHVPGPTPRANEMASQAMPKVRPAITQLLGSADRPTARFNDPTGRPKPHVAGLGETLFTDHLITVELAGSLLFVALIGAVAIATPKAAVRPGNPLKTADRVVA